ncbi:hypothetical protein MLD38_035019 [Melastoma candidum]|uniref:Uncharacterized protein n=1 Tax=Melastoma candidum TaxID=119954 RepID=A0ACB9MDN1_9MYRT|nr:hypothetical protein MLD38_035019 [Melastoma candidum]
MIEGVIEFGPRLSIMGPKGSGPDIVLDPSGSRRLSALLSSFSPFVDAGAHSFAVGTRSADSFDLGKGENMADQFQSMSSSGTSNASEEGSESTINLNIKTLDSRIYHFQVDRNILVSAFKEKIANEMGVSVGQQRLIFKGKVVKDDHLLSQYHVENGDTLHLVQRQPAQAQPASASGSNETNANNGADSNTGVPRGRVGQISHSVVLGTINVGDQGDGALPDVSRVIGAVLNSIGLGGQTPVAAGGIIQTPISLNIPGQTSQGVEQERANGSGEAQASHGQAVPNQPISSSPQVVQIPIAATAIPIPSLLTAIPDSLSTLSEFMTRMEQSLAQWSQLSPSTSTAQLASSGRGVPSVEVLSSVLRQAERLLRDHSVATISHIAGRLEREGTSAEATIRGQLQTESSQIGMAMQHLGALFLELGRTMLTLRMGQSPADSFVNAGPAVYISPLGPNPIMVQPFPLQANSIIGGPFPPSPAAFGPVGVGNPPRNINIHIHAVGGRPGGLEGMQGQRVAAIGSNNSDTIRSTIVPPHPTVVSASSATGSRSVFPASEPHPASNPLSSSVEANRHLASFASNSIQGNQPTSGAVFSIENPSASSGGPINDAEERESKDASATNRPEIEQEREDKERNPEAMKAPDAVRSTETSTSTLGSSPVVLSENSLGNRERNFLETSVPLGLGLGGLERKKRGTNKQYKQPVGDSDGATSTSVDQKEISTGGQQILQSISQRPTPATTPAPPTSASETLPSGAEGPGGRINIAGIMPQILQNPALNGLLADVSQQNGAGSPIDLRNMLQQLSHPAMVNTAHQIAQQIDTRDIGSMFAELGGQGGGLDLSRMVQQMMPIVSQALGSGSIQGQSLSTGNSEPQGPSTDSCSYREAENRDLDSQMNLDYVARNIEDFSYPEDVFIAMAENAVRPQGDRSTADNILDVVCVEEDLGREYAEVLRRDLRHRLHRESSQDR